MSDTNKISANVLKAIISRVEMGTAYDTPEGGVVVYLNPTFAPADTIPFSFCARFALSAFNYGAIFEAAMKALEFATPIFEPDSDVISGILFETYVN